MAGRSGSPAPRCAFVWDERTGATCKTAVARGSAFCPWHSEKETERLAIEYAKRADAGMTFATALNLPVLGKPLGQASLEERNALGLWLTRAFPLEVDVG